MGMVKGLREEISNTFMVPDEDDEGNVCRRFMAEKGYFDLKVPFIFQSSCDLYKNYYRPDDQRIRNKIDYLELYNKGLLSLRETYVLAKNKNFLLYDNSMLGMIFAIEDKIFEDAKRSPGYGTSDQVQKAIADHLNQSQRCQINGFTTSISWLIEFYMNEEGYCYDPMACNSFMPMIKHSNAVAQ